MKNSLYTFILEFKGGTYISQFRGDSPEEALLYWINNVEVQYIQGLKEKHRTKLTKRLDEFSFVAIDGAINTWCYDFSIRGKSGLLNFVRTIED